MESLLPKPKLNVAESPHWRDGSSLLRTQIFWMLALAPALVAAVAMHGARALGVIGMAVGSSVLLDAAANRVMGGRDFTSNGSSVTLGLMLAFLLPLDAPWWLVLVAAFLAIIVGKKLFGGWGAYPVHPVALSMAMLHVSWPQRLDYTASMLGSAWESSIVEPLRMVGSVGGGAEALYDKADLLMGRQAAGAGGGMVLWLLLGALFLLLLRQIPWRIPAAFLAGLFLTAWLLEWLSPGLTAGPVFHLLAGSTVLTAFFLLPEHSTSPVNPWPMLLYGFLGGLLLVLIRAFSVHADGGIFAILLLNLVSPLLDRWTPSVRGGEVKAHA